tara:strand:- start:1939 stop:2064 length:126 start_codon:yes stop_codon:yes gene_type:complete
MPKAKNQSRRVNFCIMYWGAAAFFLFLFFLKKENWAGLVLI